MFLEIRWLEDVKISLGGGECKDMS